MAKTKSTLHNADGYLLGTMLLIWKITSQNATKGPWVADGVSVKSDHIVRGVKRDSTRPGVIARFSVDQAGRYEDAMGRDAVFTAMARQAVPLLIKDCEKCRAEIRRLKKLVGESK